MTIATSDNRPEATGLPDPRRVPTLTIPQAGSAAFGLNRAASYSAAKRGDLPTIKVGRQYRVPTAALYEALGIPLPA